MKIVLGNDHAAVTMKFDILAHLEEMGHEVINIGTDEAVSCDYPYYAKKAGEMVASGEADCGILICGTGIGMSIAANKMKGIRAAHCPEPISARYAKEHNNANIICFGARIVGSEISRAIVDAWLNSEYKGGRHQKRLDMVEAMEEAMEE